MKSKAYESLCGKTENLPPNGGMLMAKGFEMAYDEVTAQLIRENAELKERLVEVRDVVLRWLVPDGISSDFAMIKLAGLVDPLPPSVPALDAAFSNSIKARDAIEEKAREVYDGWKDQEGWVPWVEGGNSKRQDEARRIASSS